LIDRSLQNCSKVDATNELPPSEVMNFGPWIDHGLNWPTGSMHLNLTAQRTGDLAPNPVAG
jgi:hypothetical protein